MRYGSRRIVDSLLWRWFTFVHFVRIVSFVRFVAIWGLIFVTCPWCFRYLQFMVFAICNRLGVGYLNS